MNKSETSTVKSKKTVFLYREENKKLFYQDLAVQFKAFGLAVTDKQLEDFATYYELLIRTNETLNLTAITEPHEVAVKHMVDSLSCYHSDIFIDGLKVLDLGTGAGFPGIPLAIYNRNLHIVLFDSLNKRLQFLKTVIDTLDLKNVTILHGRAEDLSHDAMHREQYDIVTSRAVARLPILAEWCIPYVKKEGYFVALKGAAYEEEIKEGHHALQLLGAELAKIKPVALPTLADKRAILYIKKIGVTPPIYPRKPKNIKERPL